MAAKAGDNRKAEELRRLLFFDHVGAIMNIDAQIAAQEAKVKAIRGDRKKAIGLAKSHGIMAKTIEFAIEAQTAQDPKAFVDGFIHNGEILEWCGLFPGFQADLFADRMPHDERIQKAGELAGYTNRPRESGYAPDSPEAQTWLKAYDSAQKSRNENLAEALEAANAPAPAVKGRGGRKPKAKAGQPLDGETPDDAKQAANDDKPATPTPPKPDDDKTNAEKEAERQAAAGFH